MSRLLQTLVHGTVFGASSWVGFALTRPPEEAPVAPAPAPLPAPAPAASPAGSAASPLPGKKVDAAPPAPALGDLDGGAPPPEKSREILKVTFTDLSQWDLDPKDVQVPRSILAMGGRTLDVVGYMIPYGDPDSVTEFALVRDLGSCCFGQAPQPHHVIECRMPEGAKTSYVPGPVRVRGKFRVEEHRQGQFLISVYSMTVDDCTEVR